MWDLRRLFPFLLVVFAIPAVPPTSRLGPTPSPTPRAAYTRLPLVFEPAEEPGRFLSRGPGYTLRLAADGGELVTGRGRLRLSLVGGTPGPELVGVDPQPGRVHYLRGSDPRGWRTHVPTFARVAYRQAYPGIDLVFYGTRRELEYDFVVAPGADPGAIAMAFDGADRLELASDGSAVIRAAGAAVRLRRPFIYQRREGRVVPVAGGFVLQGLDRLGFWIGAYDRALPLVIDPVLEYSTYLGGGNPLSDNPFGGGADQAFAVAVDAGGNAYVAGSTASTNFPTTPGAAQTTTPQKEFGCGMPGSVCPDAFVAKFDPGGSLLWATYLGGGDRDWANAIALDGAGSVYVTGSAASTDFPTTPGAFQRTHGGSFCGSTHDAFPCADVFVTKLSPDGSALVYSTLVASNAVEEGFGITVDAAGNAYVTGSVRSASGPGPGTGPPTSFPTVNAVQPAFGGGGGDAFVLKLNAAGSALLFSTYLGGGGMDWGRAIAVDADGNAYVTGETSSPNFPTAGALQGALAGDVDAFVVKVGPGGALVYSTYLGGANQDVGYGIAVDGGRQAHVTGFTFSGASFPIVDPLPMPAGGSGDAFVARLTPGGGALSRATLFGGSGWDIGLAIALDGTGNVSVTGATTSRDLPTVEPLQAANADPPGCTSRFECGDAFVITLSPGGLRFATYLGGSGHDEGVGIAVDAGHVYVAGWTNSRDFPTANAWQPTADRGCTRFCGNSDAFVAKIGFPAPPGPPGSGPGPSARRSVRADFDGDGRADLAVFRRATGEWFVFGSATGFTGAVRLGNPALGDVPVTADYDGDGKTDLAVYRMTTAEWFVFGSATGFGGAVRLGSPGLGDVPVPGDYDGDGKADLAVYRTTTAEWFVFGSATGFGGAVRLGSPGLGDVPVPADYDGDGKTDLAVYRTTTGEWFVFGSATGFGGAVPLGSPGHGDVPIPADYDGDGKTDLAVYRTTTAEWFIFGSATGFGGAVRLGSPGLGDVPVPADYDGDGKTDLAVYRTTTGEWFIFGSATGFAGATALGAPAFGDVPVTTPRPSP